MKQADAIALIEKGIDASSPQYWADLGCGSGTFTMAMHTILPAGSHLVAIDKQVQNFPIEFIRAILKKMICPYPTLMGS